MVLSTTQERGVVDASAQWQELLQALTSAATDAPLPEILHDTARAACDIIGCRHAVISVIDEVGALEHFVQAGIDSEAAERMGRLPIYDSPLGAVIVDSRTVRVSDTDPAAPTEDYPSVTTLLGVPIKYDGLTVGGIYLSEPTGGETFTASDEQLAELIAAAAAAAVKRTRLTAAFAQRQRWLTESAELTRLLLSGDHGDPLRLVVERVLAIADAAVVAVVTERADGQGFEVIDAAGPFAAELRGRLIDLSRTFAARLIADGTPRVCEDLASSAAPADLVELVGAETAILVPLTGPGVDRGLLAVCRHPEQPAFTAAEIEATTVFAGQMTLALQLAESRARRERVTLLDERDRIARDLHDHVIQRLFAIGLTVQSAGAQVDGETSKRLLATVDDIDQTIGQIRSTIYELTGPLVSADSSIRVRAARLIDEMAPVLGYRPDLAIRGPIDFGVDEDVTDDCIAVLREALTNVARHARATRVEVALSVTSTALTLEVTDDGSGIGPAVRRSGLANLRTRAERRRGMLTVSSATPRGTRLTWFIPVG
jgi:signal transduction histidine kinase